MSARHVFYEGRVQGVGFRYSVRHIATGFDVTGWVRNVPIAASTTAWLFHQA